MLTLSAVLVKVIGLLYRIPMLNRLGSEGMGYFNTAYEVYALLCVLATAGLPVAMSVLISEVTATGKDGCLHTAPTVRRIFSVSLGVFLAVGSLGSGAMFLLAEPLGKLLGNPEAAACIRAISPTVFLICLSGAFRGYFQGQRNMVPTAVSQVIEAMGKLFLGLLFAGYAKSKGADLPTTAAYAVLGLTVGTALSVLYLTTDEPPHDVHLHLCLPALVNPFFLSLAPQTAIRDTTARGSTWQEQCRSTASGCAPIARGPSRTWPRSLPTLLAMLAGRQCKAGSSQSSGRRD